MTLARIPSKTRRGFSLIEMMSAMAVLSILMFVLLRIFGNSANAWTLGTGQSQQVSDAALALNLMAAELQNSEITITGGNDLQLRNLETGSLVRYSVDFVDSTATSYDPRKERNVLRKEITPATGGGTQSFIFIDDLLDFRVSALAANPAAPELIAVADFNGIGQLNNQPPMVSLYIETLSDMNQLKAYNINDATKRTEFEDRRSRRYSKSVQIRRFAAYSF